MQIARASIDKVAIVELCAGIGGARRALELLQCDVAVHAFSEIDGEAIVADPGTVAGTGVRTLDKLLAQLLDQFLEALEAFLQRLVLPGESPDG